MKEVDTHVPRYFRTEKAHLSFVPQLSEALCEFLDRWATNALLTSSFCAIIGDGDGRTKFTNLLAACGYPEEPSGFFHELLRRLETDSSDRLTINGIVLPHLLVTALLDIALPGSGLISIKTVEELEKAVGICVPFQDRPALQQVIDTYPVRLSMHVIRQMQVSPAVASQYLPFVEELDPIGPDDTWTGRFHHGLLEQMYHNRVIFLLNMSCPVYCRFCFRKHKKSRNENAPTVADIKRAVAHVAASPAIKEILITGGDPFLDRANMDYALNTLMSVDHVQTLRLATRSIAYHPQLFLADSGALLSYLKEKNERLRAHGIRLEIATHFNHPDEISPQSLMIITKLVTNGIAVYVQTPFLSGCNDQGPELVRLFSLLRGAGAEPHYIFFPCHPIRGNTRYRAAIAEGPAIAGYLRAHLSDRFMPALSTATPIGKIDWHTSGWAVEPVADKEGFIWLRTPYTPDYFKAFTPATDDLETMRINAEGTIDIQYRADIGDESLFLGNRPQRSADIAAETIPTETIAEQLRAPRRLAPSLGETDSAEIARVHETRVEVMLGCGREELAYIDGDERITDVVALAANDLLTSLHLVHDLVARLKECTHVNVIRLYSPEFCCQPQRYSETVIQRLAALNALTVADPLRLEIESRFLEAEQITSTHDLLTRRLNAHGITVYNNTPLLGRINDTPQAVHRLAYRCRKAGIEFHHLYVAGTPLQNMWNAKHPVALDNVVDIATLVRRLGSGREVPRYIISTPLGEVDFGLCSQFSGSGRTLRVKLLPYDYSYYRAIDPDFHPAQGVEMDDDGRPLVPIIGLTRTGNFALS